MPCPGALCRSILRAQTFPDLIVRSGQHLAVVRKSLHNVRQIFFWLSDRALTAIWLIDASLRGLNCEQGSSFPDAEKVVDLVTTGLFNHM
jgi:hypothetical protein